MEKNKMEENRFFDDGAEEFDFPASAESSTESGDNAIGAQSEEENIGLEDSHLPDENDSAENPIRYEAERIKNERAEYERLIKTRFKEFYREDTQRLINRRFRKLKETEESLRAMEENFNLKQKELEKMGELLVNERKRVIKETEDRVINEIRTRQMRPDENALFPRIRPTVPDVSKLTRVERASIAKRAANGEKIKF